MPVRLRTSAASTAWRALIIAFTRMRAVLADEMDAAVAMPLERYEILLMLSQADGAAMRPSQIADGQRISRSGATRLIDRLERDGLVERRSCDTDRRGSLVALTTQGEEAFRTAGRVHLRGIDRHVGSHLTGAELAELHRLLTKLADGVPSQDPNRPRRHEVAADVQASSVEQSTSITSVDPRAG